MLVIKSNNKYTYNAFNSTIALLLLVLFLYACRHKRQHREIEPSFYYWKSVFKINNVEQAVLDSLKVKTIYIKFFDVNWNERTKQPEPVAKLISSNYKLPDSITAIPTVFITNECLQQMDTAQITGLANNIYSLMQDIINTNSFHSIAEIQFDCDWSSTTRDKYFALLKKTKALWQNSAIPVSATIRLHQIKFLEKAGTPPVDRGLLMCYNMGNVKSTGTSNSILDPAEVRKFSGRIGEYPLPLDVAFPLFEWKVFFHNNDYAGLIKNLPAVSLQSPTILQKQNNYHFTTDTVINGYHFIKGDILRNEESSLKDILSTADIISPKIKNTRCRVALFHLDSLLLNKYSAYELESIYGGLR
jgi:hypothetical protein